MTCTVDTSNFMKAQAVWQAHSKRNRAENLNRAAYFVIQSAQKLTPSTPTGRMDSELNVMSSPKVLKNGKLSRAKGKQLDTITALGRLTPSQQGPRMTPLAGLIVSARANTLSGYNFRTGWRFRLMQSPRNGVSRRAGDAKMRAAISRMVKSRHSSGHFFVASWNGIKNSLKPHLGKGYAVASSPAMDGTNMSIASPAQPVTSPMCVIENRMGMGGKTTMLDERRNLAAHRILGGALQTAIDTQFYRDTVEFDRRGWATIGTRLSEFGVVVTP